MRSLHPHSVLRRLVPAWLVLLLAALPPAAGGVQPVQEDIRNLVDAVVADVLSDIGANKATYQQDSAALQAMVNTRLIPHFNFTRITQLAMGKNAASATPEQRKQLVAGFQALLVRTYANSLLDIPAADAKSNYRYVSQKNLGSNGALVQIEVKRERTKPVLLNLRMENRNDKWQVIDIVIDGVSMVITYRSQFEEKINAAGIDGLILALQSEW